MAEERITNQDLAAFLVKKHGLGEEEAEAFVKEFFLLIEEALEKNKIAKVKGFGTFKLTEVKSRESINVNTGERFEIQEHTKVSFTPDPLLRDIINNPFAHFETIVLKDGVNFDDEPEDDNDFEADTDITKLTTDEIQVTPTVPVVEEPIPELPADEPTSTEETEVADESGEINENPEPSLIISEIVPEENLKTEDDITDDHKDEPNQLTETEVEESQSQSGLDLEEIIAQELQEKSILFNNNTDDNSPNDSASETLVKSDKSHPSKKFMIIAIVSAIITSGAAVLFAYFPTFMDDILGYKEKKKEVIEVVTTSEEPISVPIMSDSIGRTEEIKSDIPEKIVAENAKSVTEEPKRDVVANTETLVVTSKATQPTVKKQQSKPAETKKSENSVNTQPKMTNSDITRDNTPVRPDSTSYKITGTKATHTIQSGETLTRVSLRFYGTKDLWPYLVMHNRNKIPNPAVVPAGLTINIPELEKK